MLNSRFIEYFRDTFFQEKEEEFQQFLTAIEKPIPRTIRIKPGYEETVKTHLESDGWILTETRVPRVHSMDRKEDFDPLERRLGFSLDHLMGNFYIQELAAAHPVDILAEGKIHTDEFLILDMASSPGGKTTQLAEYYPNSFIIANEPTRERIPQLLQNLHRMGTPNVGITLYPGQYWKNYSETFDRILLDAPCSGEGTLYKGTDAVKHWHIKNIKEIARLQTKLLDAAIHALKVGGEMIYSTCSLNLLENEGVLETIQERYGDTFEIVFSKKFWPHRDGTGGFFVAKIRKTQSINEEERNERRGTRNEKLGRFRGNLGGKWNTHSGITLYEHDKKILAVAGAIHKIPEDIYFMRFGEEIGRIDGGMYSPDIWATRYLDIDNIPQYIFRDEIELDSYLRGGSIEGYTFHNYTGPIQIYYDNIRIGIEQYQDTIIHNSFPKDWQRK